MTYLRDVSGERNLTALCQHNFEKIDAVMGTPIIGLDASAIDNSEAIQAAFDDMPEGTTLILPSGDFEILTGLTITKDNVRIIFLGRILAGEGFTDGGTMLTLTGENVTIDQLWLNGQDNAMRGLTVMPTSRQVSLHFPVFRSFYAASTQTTSPYALGIRGDVRNFECFRVDIDGVDTDATGAAFGISRGIHVTSILDEAAPFSIKFFGGSVRNITPEDDGDGVCLQNNWTEHIGVYLIGMTFEGCAKRGIKSMLNGVFIIDCDVIAPGYAGISVYGSNTVVRGCKVKDAQNGADMCIEVGAIDLTLSDILIEGCEVNLAAGADITTTGDGIRVFFSSNSRVHCVDNTVRHARIGIHYTGENVDCIISLNTVTDTTLASIQVSQQNISAVDYFPDTVTVANNIGSASGNTICVSVINCTNPIAIGNTYRGNGTGCVFTSCTGGTQHSNPSYNDIGWLTTQFALDANGKPYIKDGAVLQTITLEAIAFDSAAAASGDLWRAKRSADYSYAPIVENTSTGTSAIAGSGILKNDAGDILTAGLGGSNHSDHSRKVIYNLTGAGSAGFRWQAPTGAIYEFQVNGVNSLKLDGDNTSGNTRLLLYDVDNGQLERVTVGIADSGGAGFKLLRIPN
jgi:hypothetical protein